MRTIKIHAWHIKMQALAIAAITYTVMMAPTIFIGTFIENGVTRTLFVVVLSLSSFHMAAYVWMRYIEKEITKMINELNRENSNQPD